MFERNGVVFFSKDDVEDHSDHPAFTELAKVSLGDVRFPFGFFIEEDDGQHFVRPATEDERIRMLLRAFPDSGPELLRSDRCINDVFSDRRCKEIIPCSADPTVSCTKAFSNTHGVRQFACACVDRF